MDLAKTFHYICDFYYLYYNIDDGLKGTIYRHYTTDDKIDFIYGTTPDTINELTDIDKKNIFIFNIKRFFKDLNFTTNILKEHKYSYLNKYDYNTADIENYYKKLKLGGQMHGIYNIDDDIASVDDGGKKIITIGIFFTFMETSYFDNDNILLNTGREKVKFKDYIKNLSRTSRTSRTSKTYKVITEQKQIELDTIKYYESESADEPLRKPVIIEYEREYEDDNPSKLVIVDGNHRVAYHIKNNHKYIPVIIFVKYLDIGIYK